MLRLVVDDQPPGPPAMAHPGECLPCFVERMVAAHGCGNALQFTRLWRNRAAPRATALERRLAARGGFCDCEVLFNAYLRRTDLEREECDAEYEDTTKLAPPCQGVRRGSSRPCGWWITRSRY